MLVCPSCGAENPEDKRFCGDCGTKLETAPVREERKVITALFCDLVGSTALGERLDAEDISRLLHSYQEICRARIDSHGGVVEKFIGDAVVGVFGVPLAHEDDPERAVRAALRIIEDIGASDLGIEVRIGVNTGEALVRLDVDPRSGEGFATGDTMNTAARLEAAASVMGVAVGAGTYHASTAAIVYEELPPIAAKGKSEPLAAWRAFSPVARVGNPEVDSSPFVGRDLELGMLIQLFERSRTRPSTEFVTVIAEPGIGKSRLVRELARHVEQLPELITWREGRCLPYGDRISFWPLGEIVKAQAGILETDDQPTIATKLDHVVTEPDPQNRSWIIDRIAPLVGLDTDTVPPQGEEAFAAWRRFIESMAASGPTVLVVEDLHWADDAFVAFLAHLTEHTAGLPLCVIVTARPELEERHPSWPPGRRSTLLSLSPLADQDVEALIAESLPDGDARLIEAVLDRAGGSPLYAEQLAAMLRERALPILGGALDETTLPAGVQALIAARIDALPAEPKRVLMQAAVVGKTFWSGAVAALGEHEALDATLNELVRREFCRPVHPPTMEGELEFGFWHALVRDVAYAELTKTERARMHATTARWIADRTERAMGEDAEVIVHHIESARAFGDNQPDLDGLLCRALIGAGRSAMRTDIARGSVFLSRALEMLDDDDPSRVGATRDLGQVLHMQGRSKDASELLERLFRQLIADDDVEGAADVGIDLYHVLWQSGDLARGDSIVEEVRRRTAFSETPARVKILARDAHTEMVNDHLERAVELAHASKSMANTLGVPVPIQALAVVGLCRLLQGDAEAEDVAREALARSLADGDMRGATSIMFNIAYCVSEFDLHRALAAYDDLVELASRVDADAIGWAGRAGRLQILAELGRFDEATEEAPLVLEWARSHGDTMALESALGTLAAVELERDERVSDPDALAEVSRKLGNSKNLALPAEVAFQRGMLPVAHEYLLEAVRSIDPQDAMRAYSVTEIAIRLQVPDLVRELVEGADSGTPAKAASRFAALALLAEHDGDLEAARDNFLRAAGEFASLGSRMEMARTLQGLGRCLLALGNTEESIVRLKEARAFWADMKATLRLREIDELMGSVGVHPSA